jgi:hypothetical protein
MKLIEKCRWTKKSLLLCRISHETTLKKELGGGRSDWMGEKEGGREIYCLLITRRVENDREREIEIERERDISIINNAKGENIEPRMTHKCTHTHTHTHTKRERERERE